MNNTPPQPKAKKPKVTTYLLRNLSKDDLNRMFYEGYDEKFFYSKALALHHIINLAENEQEPLRQHAEEGVQAKEDINDKFFEALRAEMYFTEMHQFECFLPYSWPYTNQTSLTGSISQNTTQET